MDKSYQKNIEFSGMAGFLALAMQFIKTDKNVQRSLQQKHLKIRLVLETPDFLNSVLLKFTSEEVNPYPISVEHCQSSQYWDAKMTAPAKVFLDYFLGRIGVIRPFLTGKIKAKGMLNLMKLIWYIKANQRFFGANRSFADGVFYRMHNTHSIP
jgi:hypothetical protein